MDSLNCGLMNAPFTILTITTNAFYIFCMVCPLHEERIKKPLQLLLGSLVCCTITYLVSSMVVFLTQTTADNINSLLAWYVVFACSLSTCLSSSVWLNFFYYTQIVPAQRALFIWIKNNIKPIIYCIWLVERILCFFIVNVMLFDHFTLINHFSDGFSYNLTMNHVMIPIPLSEWQGDMHRFAGCIMRTHFIVSALVILVSSGSTVVYLCRHMRRMVLNGQPLTCHRFRGQVRVTFTGILQLALYIFYAAWSVYYSLSSPVTNDCSHFTVLNFYMVVTTFSLGIGQSMFRQRLADIWLRAVHWCKAPQVQQSEQRG